MKKERHVALQIMAFSWAPRTPERGPAKTLELHDHNDLKLSNTAAVTFGH